MSAVYGGAQGFGRDGRPQSAEATRQGTTRVVARAQTYVTYATVTVNADGSGEVEVTRKKGRGRLVILHERFGPESQREPLESEMARIPEPGRRDDLDPDA